MLALLLQQRKRVSASLGEQALGLDDLRVAVPIIVAVALCGAGGGIAATSGSAREDMRAQRAGGARRAVTQRCQRGIEASGRTSSAASCALGLVVLPLLREDGGQVAQL